MLSNAATVSLWDAVDVIHCEHACTQRLGVHVTRLLRVPGMAWDTGPALCFRQQAQFDPVA